MRDNTLAFGVVVGEDMDCPDETTIAAFMEALLPADRAACVEQHIDTCAECAALLASLGRVYGPENADHRRRESRGIQAHSLTPAPTRLATSTPAPTAIPASRGELIVRRNLALQAAMCVVHFAGMMLLLPIVIDALRMGRGSVSVARVLSVPDAPGAAQSESWVGLVATLYVILWLHLGLGWTVLNVYGLARRTTWARWTSLSYAMLSLPSVFGTPTSAYALWSLMRPEAIDALARRIRVASAEQPANTDM